MAEGFQSQLKRIANARKQACLKLIRGSFIEVGTRVIERSPVDTGRFVSNWNGGFWMPNLKNDDSEDPSKSYVLGRLLVELNSYELGDTYFFTNSLPYAFRLEYEGWSYKRPEGMVRVSVAEFKSIVKEQVSFL